MKDNSVQEYSNPLYQSKHAKHNENHSDSNALNTSFSSELKEPLEKISNSDIGENISPSKVQVLFDSDEPVKYIVTFKLVSPCKRKKQQEENVEGILFKNVDIATNIQIDKDQVKGINLDICCDVNFFEKDSFYIFKSSLPKGYSQSDL